MSDPSETIDFSSLTTVSRKIVYPIAPEGIHNKCLVSKVVVALSTHPKALPGSYVVSFHIQLPTEYQGTDDKPHHHKAFSKRFMLTPNKEAGLDKFCSSLTGVSLLEAKVVTPLGAGQFNWKEMKSFENMECDVVIKHNRSGDRTYANIDSVFTSAEQKKANLALCPPQDAQSEMPPPMKGTEEEVPPSMKKEEEEVL